MTTNSNAPKAAPTHEEKDALKTAKMAFGNAQSSMSGAKKAMLRAKGRLTEHLESPERDNKYVPGTYFSAMRKMVLAGRESDAAEAEFDKVRDRIDKACVERAKAMSSGSARLISSHCTRKGIALDLHQVSVDYVDGSGRKVTRTVHARAIRKRYTNDGQPFERVVAYRSKAKGSLAGLAFIVRKYVENAQSTMAATQSVMAETRSAMMQKDEDYSPGEYFDLLRAFIVAQRTFEIEKPRLEDVEKEVGLLSRIAA